MRNLENEIDELKGQINEIRLLLTSKSEAENVNGIPDIDASLVLIEKRKAEKILSCIGSNNRLDILLTLLKNPMTVAALVEKHGYNSTGQVYHHLKPLLAANLIAEDKKIAKGVYYTPPHRVQGIKMILAGISDLITSEPVNVNWDTSAEIHEGATMIDERYMVTAEETNKIIATFFSSTEPLILKAFPPKEKKKLVILRVISEQFEAGKRYQEKELNQILKAIYHDFATIRRYLIMYGFLGRTDDCREYWLKK